MSQKMISRRDAFSFFGLAAALGFAVPTTALTTSDAKAQAQQTAPAPTTPAPTTPGNVRYRTASRLAADASVLPSPLLQLLRRWRMEHGKWLPAGLDRSGRRL